ncbi:MAG: helix-hairpin-helix domain-containing protein, partial [Gammaproteobacteria bacterium]
KRKGGLEPFEQKLMAGMRARGYRDDFARRIFQQIKGFGDYGFPESHSASFALLAYVSAWLKCHHPAAFCCALLNSQPMGFYAPSQLVQDARRHGVGVRPVDVRHSHWDCSLEHDLQPPALRLGFNQVKNLAAAAAKRIESARMAQPFASVADLAERAQLDKRNLEALASADALKPLAGNRHQAFWAAGGIEAASPVFGVPRIAEASPLLKAPQPVQNTIADYASTGLTLRDHPLALLRPRLQERGVVTAAALWQRRNGSIALAAGLVICRQRPLTAAGVTFVTLEDETGQVNLIVWPKTALAQRKPLLKARLLGVSGIVQQQDGVLHLVAGKLEDWSDWVGDLSFKARDFH